MCCRAARCLRVRTCSSATQTGGCKRNLRFRKTTSATLPLPQTLLSAGETQPCEHLQTPVIKTGQAQQQLKINKKNIKSHRK